LSSAAACVRAQTRAHRQFPFHPLFLCKISSENLSDHSQDPANLSRMPCVLTWKEARCDLELHLSSIAGLIATENDQATNEFRFARSFGRLDKTCQDMLGVLALRYVGFNRVTE
jgi:hypothetical protein